MKRLAYLGILAFFGITESNATEPAEGICKIETWKDGAQSAITFTFDDNCKNQFEKALPSLNKHGISATQFIVTNWMDDWNKVLTSHNNGNEIASHTITHPKLGEMAASDAEKELSESKRILESRIPNYTCKTMAYPYCIPVSDELCGKYYFAARHCQGYIEDQTPKSIYNISSIMCGNQSNINSYESLKAILEQAQAKKGWAVLLFHGIDDDGGYSPFPSEAMEKAAAYLSSRKKDYWTDTFGNVAMYIKERDNSKVEVKSSKGNLTTLALTNSLDGKYYNMPLTLTCKVPAKAKTFAVSQKGKTIKSKIINAKDGSKFIQFDAVPNNGDIAIKSK